MCAPSRGHRAREVHELLERQEARDDELLVAGETLEDRGAVPRWDARERRRHVLRVEIAQEIRDVLGMLLVEELAQLLGRLREEPLHLGLEERAESHGRYSAARR